jgi:iron(III) transport system ATP-binding protein
MMPLSIRDLAKSYGGPPVLAGVDLDVPAGSLTAILGPSGCGKTTLLRLIAGFLTPDAGTIRLGDRVVASPDRSVPTARRNVGYVAQEGALFPHLDVAANISFGLPRARRRGGARVDDLLDLVGLDPSLARRSPHELSGGQQQRVALARALAPEPGVVLLDEPFSSLDAGLRGETGRAVVQALRALDATAVLVTHDQAEALSLADQVAVMRAGRLVQVGAPQALYEAPTDRGVAEFVGAAVVLPATWRDGVAECALGVLPGSVPNGLHPHAVMVRPEQLLLGQPDRAPVRGLVREVSYYGHDASVRLVLEGSGSEVVARVRGSDAPAPGALVGVSVDGPARAL